MEADNDDGWQLFCDWMPMKSCHQISRYGFTIMYKQYYWKQNLIWHVQTKEQPGQVSWLHGRSWSDCEAFDGERACGESWQESPYPSPGGGSSPHVLKLLHSHWPLFNEQKVSTCTTPYEPLQWPFSRFFEKIYFKDHQGEPSRLNIYILIGN